MFNGRFKHFTYSCTFNEPVDIVRMFETNHEMRAMFSSVKDIATIAEMRANKLLEGHAMKVIGIIDDILPL